MIPAITEVNFPSYATLSQASVSLTEMGDRVITTQIKIDGDVVPSFNDWELTFKGERFILPVKEPQAAKDNTSRRSIIDLTFESWAVFQLKRYFFVSMSQIDTGVAIPDQYNASIILPLESFVELFNKVLSYYFGDQIRMDLFGAGQHIYSTDPVSIEINKTYIWDVLVKFYELFNVRWNIVYDSQTSAYVIKVGYTADAITDHDFEYGYQGGLLKFERQVQDTNISNILIGRGGEKNLPYRYFKLQDPNNTEWAADPDAIPELANIYFDRLRDINFRWYVRGWMQNSHRDTSWDATHTFPTYTDNDCPEEFQFAFHKGQTDTKFNPVEYVKDDASITKYGERWGAVDDNDEVYPTIQGRIISGIGRVDEVVSVSPIETDDIQAAAKAAATTYEIGGTKMITASIYEGSTGAFDHESEPFTVPSGNVGNIQYEILKPYNPKTGEEYPETIVAMNTAALNIRAIDIDTGTEYSPYGLQPGTYKLKYTFSATNYGHQDYKYVAFGFSSLQVTLSSSEGEAWKPTFDIWIKNIWQTTQGANESDDEYSTRVWQSILGDRVGNEAKVVFSDGFMSVSEDYEFVIASYPVPDRSKTITSGGVNYDSEWKITLYKNDAEFEATGLYVPNATTGGSPSAGDHLFFVGIDMPFQYVIWAEETLNGALADPVINKTAALDNLSDINPSWLITLDKVRCNTHEGQEYGQYLADRLAAGATVRIKDRRFTNGQTLTLYVQSITYVWNEPTDANPYLVPDIEVVLSDKIVSVEGPVTRVSNELEVVKSTYARSADIEQTVRSVGNALFLKKTGESDNSQSPTTFSSKVSSKNFRKGDIGGAGWGMYQEAPEVQATQAQTRAATRDASATEAQDGNSVFEVDKLIVRKELHVNELIANQISYVGGKKITSAASIECTQVVEDANYYYCYFDQKQGTVANLFQVNDIALGQNFDEENVETRYYRMRVAEVGVDYIKLAKSGRDGSGAPEKGDIIVQYGNTTTASRQYVIVEDVIGGGYQRMISGLSSTSSAGKEYYFAGRENVSISGSGSGSGSGAGDGTRWFVGDTEREYAEWKNGQLNIKGNILVRKGDNSYASMGYLADALPLGGATLIQGGLILTSMMQLGYTANDVFTVMAGINGKPDTSLSDQTQSIAAWFGGPMVDKDHMGSGSGSGAGTGYAKTLFRMDGSGYMAGGNIYWNKQGYGGIPGVTWSRENNQDIVTIGGNVHLVSASGDTVTNLITAVQQISNWFVEDTVNGVKYLKLKIASGGIQGLATEGFISAGGVSSGSGGGGGITEAGMWDLLANSDSSHKISLAHLPYTAGTNISISADGVISYTGAAGGVTSVAGLTGVVEASALYNALGLNTEMGIISNSLQSLQSQIDSVATRNMFDEVVAASLYADTAAISNLYSGAINLNGIGDLATSISGLSSSITGVSGRVTTIEGYFNSGILGVTHGGTGLSGIAAFSLLYASAENTLSALAPNTASTKKFLTMTGTGSAGAVPSWGTVGITDALGTTAKGSASMPIYYTGSALAEITSLDLLSKNTGYVKANRFYLNSSTYFEIDSNGYVHLSFSSATGKGFYVDGFVSAAGISTSGGGGGGGGLTPLGMWQLLTNNSSISSYDDNTKIALAHIPSLPWSQITSGLPTTLSGYGITNAYTKTEVDNLIGAINQFHYEIYASTSAVTNPQSNVLYLIGPTGSGADKYEEYVYSNSTWTKIGDTSIDLSGYMLTANFTAANIVSTLGNTAVNRATADASGNTITSTYQTIISDLSTIRSRADEGHTAYGWGDTLSLSLQSLQSQIDSVATKNNFDELTSTALFSDVIAASSLHVSAIELAGSDLATSLSGLSSSISGVSGRVTTIEGYYSGGVLKTANGGTGLSSYTAGDMLYAPSANTLGKLAANASATKQFLTMTSSIPSWGTIAFGDLPTMYWANVAISNQSNSATTPTVATLTANTSILTQKYYIGSSDVYFEVTSDGVYFYTNGKGIYTDGFVSAGGLSTSGGGGGGINPDAMWELLLEDSSNLINVSHLPITISGSGNYIASITRTAGSSSSAGSIVATYGTLGSMAFANTSDYSTSADIAADEAIISSALTSLQSQVDAVATRDMFDELKATSLFSDVIATSDLYPSIIHLGDKSLTSTSTIVTINGTGVALAGTFNTGSITAGTAGTSSATSGYTISIPYVTMSAYGIVTGYGTHTHTVSGIPNSSLANSAITINGTATSLGGSVNVGTVTSVATGTGLTGGTITTSGTISISSTYQTYITHGETAYNDLTTVSKALQSLQSQVDAIATRNCFDELKATNIFSDIVAATSAYIGTVYGELSGNATTASYLYSSSYGVGGGTTPVYFSGGRPVTCSYSFGNSSGNAAINNGTMNTNLYANKAQLDSDGYNIASNMTTIGSAIRSLQSQVDSVATKNRWDEITATTAYIDTLSVGASINAYNINATGVIYAVTGIYSSGYVTAGATASSSDARLKDDIKTISPSRAISILSQLKGREWVWNERREAFAGKRGSGLVAQEVQKVMPWAVLDLNGEYSITYGSFWGIAIPVMQSHESRIQSLENEVKRLRFENEQLKSKLTINS